MPQEDYLFSSESVAEGHPDKVADQISDAVLDAIITQDKNCRVACETLVTTGMAVIAGEITTECYVHMPDIVRETIRSIGYTDPALGFDWENCAVLTSIDRQSPDIAQGVNRGDPMQQGAGDQGMMFGFACDDTPELMPLPIMYAHKLMRRLAEMRRSGKFPFLRPDGKGQATVRYEQDRPVAVETVIVSTQHTEDISHHDLCEAVIEECIKKTIPAEMLAPKVTYHVNPTGRFVLGGPRADTGLTGRKIIVDTYGGYAHHGGGAFSGKDPSKVDRSAAYMGRYIAKNIVKAGLARKCELQVSYAIGVAQPVSVMVNTFGTGKITEEKIAGLVRSLFDLRPRAIINQLDLLRPIYRSTAAYGHFGREEPEYTWERTDKAELLAQHAKKS